MGREKAVSCVLGQNYTNTMPSCLGVGIIKCLAVYKYVKQGREREAGERADDLMTQSHAETIQALYV